MPQAASAPSCVHKCLLGESYVARVFTFVNTRGVEIHSISDPEDKLPIPEATQIVSIGASSMWVESVTPQHGVDSPSVYRVRVWPMSEADDQPRKAL